MKELFDRLHKKNLKNLKVYISFFEIYSGRCCDLFRDNATIKIQEDKNGKLILKDLEEKEIHSPEEMIEMIEFGFS